MVFAVNADPSGNTTFDDFVRLAKASNITNPDIPSIGGGIVMMPKQMIAAAAAAAAEQSKSMSTGTVVGIVVGAAAAVLLSAVVLFCCCRRRRGRGSAAEMGSSGFMGYGASSYRSMNAPAPQAAAETHPDFEPLVPPGEKTSGANDFYNQPGAYDPPRPAPLGSQYSTAWDQQHK